MLKAFYQQLRHMASSSDGKFHEQVEKRIGEKNSPEFEEELKAAILLLPEITSRISTLWSILDEKSKVKGVGSYFITYMYSPKDFIPETEANGLFGYLDDAYLVILVYELLTEDLKHSKNPLSGEDEELRKKAIGYKSKIKSVIPDEAAKIQQMIGEILSGENLTFSKLFKTGQKDTSIKKKSSS